MKSFVARGSGAAVLIVVAAIGATALAQAPRGGQSPRSARESAPIDLTGQWVSIVTEDWRFRMVTPAKGDYPGFFLMPAGQAIAMAWDPAKDEAAGDECKSIIEDPEYLVQTPVTSTNFRKQRDRSGWDPQPCSAR